jgi:ADP-heptose:LPS heptosyltransferase
MALVETLLARHNICNRPLAVLVPGTRWETKHWHAAGFAQVARHLLHSGRAVVLAGSTGEQSRCQAVADACPGARNLAGQTTLSQLAALLQRAAICVTNDSGSMHLAVALERPVVSIFGPTDPVWIGPYDRPEAVLRAGLPCAPCYLRTIRSCPHDHACMQHVTAAMVIDRLEMILGKSCRQSA